QDIPSAVLAAIKQHLGDSGSDDIKRMTEYGKVYYEVKAENFDGDIELKILADGEVFEKEVDGRKVDTAAPPAKAPTAPAVPGSDELPLQYIGDPLPDKGAADGKLMYSPGVQNIQLLRATRTSPPDFPAGTENEKGWTYQHHVGIGLWKGKVYGVWDMTHVGEDNPPVRLVYATSDDGFNWTGPKDLYPFNKAYNSRFYFFHSSNDRMLVFASGWYPTKNVAEDRKITLIKPAADHPPAYTESKDAGFLQACREVLNNKPLLEQADYGILLGDKKMKWHEGKNWPGGKIPSIGGDLWIFGKSMCFYHRKDGVLVGTCKMGWVTQSRDDGETWSFPTIPRGIKGGGGKTWAQATPDGRYAMIYIPQDDHRFPMAVTTSDDGITFDNMRSIHSDLPPQRYEGRARPIGPQYLRGVSEWGSDGSRKEKDCIWTIYSMSKEDIWISRIPVPILAEAKNHADDNFDKIATGPRVPQWNTYSPEWAPVSIEAKGGNHYLQLEDREPGDYARAIRTFPVSKTVAR
ncbi:MAG: sialidase family protein, partial [Planctomycetota bacterium]